MCRFEEWDREAHRMGNCGAKAVSDGLCQEHLEWKDTPTPGMVAMQVVIDKHDQADRDAIVNSRRRISAQIARESVESRMAALC